MTRIAGLFGFDDQQAAQPVVGKSLANMFPSGLGRDFQVSLGKARLGWIGSGPANIAECERVLVAVDGEFYNTSELPDAENAAAVLRLLFLRHGFAEALAKLNGDFAVALYDKHDDNLWLARDRIGIKPLYYARTALGFGFASQPYGVLAMPGIGRDVDHNFVARFAASHYRYIDNDIHGSPLAAVSQLPAGHCLRVNGGKHASLFRYWTLEDLPDWEADEARLAEQYRELFSDAVKIRYDASKRPAFTLSGGMDSSSVLSSAVKESGNRQIAVSSVYEDKTYDESDDIKTILSDVAEEWIQIQISPPDIFDLVRQMVAVHNEPVATATWLSHFVLCQQMSERGFSELFGGLGGDELNAGEFEYFPYHFADLKQQGHDDQLEIEIARWAEYHDHPIFRKDRDFAFDEIARLTDPSSPGLCLVDKTRMTKYAPALNPAYFDFDTFRPEMDRPFYSCLKNRTHHDMFRETTPCCLRAEDRHGTHFGLANRLPFFDHRLVEFMFRVPGNLKIRDGVTKHLLRRATKGILPDETRNRIKKTGWNAPAHIWFMGKGLDDLLDLTNSKRFRERGVYDVAFVDRLASEHRKIVTEGLTAENHMMFLWQLLNVELWLQWVDDSVNG